VSQASGVTGLAIRELWISFRLLGLLVLGFGAGAGVALLPASVAATLERLALGMGVAVAAAAAVAAWSISAERTSGRAGWLVGRSVGRGTLIVAWFAAVGTVAVVGLVVAAALGWLAVAGFPTRPALAVYVVLVAGISAWALAAVAGGLLLGSLMPRALAAALVFVACLAAGAGAWIVPAQPGTTSLVPGAGVGLLAAATELDGVLGLGLRAAGVALALAAFLLVAARMAFDRAEL
jgi:hypothetical protein